MRVVLIVSVVLYFVGGATTDKNVTVASDPCITHQVLYEETWRSVAYIWQNGMTTKCDATITEDWYRINSTAGEDVITSCPPTDRCGTRFPIWMNGTIPDEADGIVDRTMCVSGLFNCCESQIEIQVKNCSTYNVYYLKQTSCPQAYCFGTKLVTTQAPPTTTTTTTTTITTGNSDDDNGDDEERHTNWLWIVVCICMTVIVVVSILSILIFRMYHKSEKPPTRPFSGKTRPMSPPPPYGDAVKDEDKKKTSVEEEKKLQEHSNENK